MSASEWAQCGTRTYSERKSCGVMEIRSCFASLNCTLHMRVVVQCCGADDPYRSLARFKCEFLDIRADVYESQGVAGRRPGAQGFLASRLSPLVVLRCEKTLCVKTNSNAPNQMHLFSFLTPQFQEPRDCKQIHFVEL